MIRLVKKSIKKKYESIKQIYKNERLYVLMCW